LTLASGATALGSVLNVCRIALVFDGSLGALVYQTSGLPSVVLCCGFLGQFKIPVTSDCNHHQTLAASSFAERPSTTMLSGMFEAPRASIVDSLREAMTLIVVGQTPVITEIEIILWRKEERITRDGPQLRHKCKRSSRGSSS
jgi:hypothetical protein